MRGEKFFRSIGVALGIVGSGVAAAESQVQAQQVEVRTGHGGKKMAVVKELSGTDQTGVEYQQERAKELRARLEFLDAKIESLRAEINATANTPLIEHTNALRKQVNDLREVRNACVLELQSIKVVPMPGEEKGDAVSHETPQQAFERTMGVEKNDTEPIKLKSAEGTIPSVEMALATGNYDRFVHELFVKGHFQGDVDSRFIGVGDKETTYRGYTFYFDQFGKVKFGKSIAAAEFDEEAFISFRNEQKK